MVVEDDAPLEEWTLKELKEECKTLGLSEKGKKAALIERIKEAKATPVEEVAVEEAPAAEEAVEEASVEEEAVEEAAVEEAAVEEAAVEEEAVEEAAVEAAAEEAVVEETEVVEAVPEEKEAETMEVEEDAPLEEWTLKELKEECKTLGLSEKGKKAALIERIKEAKATPEEEA